MILTIVISIDEPVLHLIPDYLTFFLDCKSLPHKATCVSTIHANLAIEIPNENCNTQVVPHIQLILERPDFFKDSPAKGDLDQGLIGNKIFYFLKVLLNQATLQRVSTLFENN